MSVQHVGMEHDHSSAEDPQEIEGLLMPDFTEYLYEDVAIKEITFKEALPPDDFGNALSRYRLELTDGSLRNINFCDPKERLTDIPVIETPALGTGSMGFNEEGQRMLGALGIPSILVGHEGEERDPWLQEIARAVMHPFRLVQELRNIHLARQAHTMVMVHRHINDWLVDTAPVDSERAFLLGKSRGAMTALWFLAYSNMLEEGPEVPFKFIVAACFNEGLNAENRHRARSQPVKEVFHIGRTVMNKLTSITTRSLNTLNASPKSIIYELAHIPTLARGDTGRALPFIHPEQKGFQMGFRDDHAGQNEIWEEVLADFDNIIFRVVPGAHGAGIVDKRTAALIMRTFDHIVGQLQSGIPPNEIDIEHLRRPLAEAMAA